MYIINFTAGVKKFPEVFSRDRPSIYSKDFYLINNWCHTTTPKSHLREATFTQVRNRNPIKPVLFLERKFACIHNGPVRFRTGFGFYSHGYTIVSVLNISHQNKQKKSHLLTKFNKHRRKRGKFILLKCYI